MMIGVGIPVTSILFSGVRGAPTISVNLVASATGTLFTIPAEAIPDGKQLVSPSQAGLLVLSGTPTPAGPVAVTIYANGDVIEDVSGSFSAACEASGAVAPKTITVTLSDVLLEDIPDGPAPFTATLDVAATGTLWTIPNEDLPTGQWIKGPAQSRSLALVGTPTPVSPVAVTVKPTGEVIEVTPGAFAAACSAAGAVGTVNVSLADVETEDKAPPPLSVLPAYTSGDMPHCLFSALDCAMLTGSYAAPSGAAAHNDPVAQLTPLLPSGAPAWTFDATSDAGRPTLKTGGGREWLEFGTNNFLKFTLPVEQRIITALALAAASETYALDTEDDGVLSLTSGTNVIRAISWRDDDARVSFKVELYNIDTPALKAALLAQFPNAAFGDALIYDDTTSPPGTLTLAVESAIVAPKFLQIGLRTTVAGFLDGRFFGGAAIYATLSEADRNALITWTRKLAGLE